MSNLPRADAPEFGYVVPIFDDAPVSVSIPLRNLNRQPVPLVKPTRSPVRIASPAALHYHRRHGAAAFSVAGQLDGNCGDQVPVWKARHPKSRVETLAARLGQRLVIAD